MLMFALTSLSLKQAMQNQDVCGPMALRRHTIMLNAALMPPCLMKQPAVFGTG
jgi:hypothetical protein